MFKKISYINLLIYLVILKALLFACIIFVSGIGLGPDEAQYWTWSRALDWGYYSKPPGIAWQIWLGTFFAGQTEFGVRLMSLIIAAAQSWLVYVLAIKSGLQTRTAFWCGVLMALCPIGMFGSLFAITDGGFLLCWTLAAIVMVDSLQNNKSPNPLLIGLCIIFGALFKWPMYAFWLFYLVFWRLYFPQQKITQILQGLLLSLLGLLPSVWWNSRHDWATFRHVSSTLQGGHGHQGGNFFEFLGSQALLVSPILFILLIMGFSGAYKNRKQLSPSLLFCGAVSLICLTLGLAASIFQKMQGNWILFAYPTAMIIIGWYCCEKDASKTIWMKIGIALSFALVLLACCFPHLQSKSHVIYRINPFKHNMGWPNLSQALTDHGYDPDNHFLVSDKYQTTSILSFYGKGQKRAYFLNLGHARKNQFSYWPGLQTEQKGKSGFFVWVENAPYLERHLEGKKVFYQSELTKYFEKVSYTDFMPLLYSEGQVVKGMMLFWCERPLDVFPEESSLY